MNWLIWIKMDDIINNLNLQKYENSKIFKKFIN